MLLFLPIVTIIMVIIMVYLVRGTLRTQREEVWVSPASPVGLRCGLLKLVLVQLQDAALLLSEDEDTRGSNTDLTTTEENTTPESLLKEDKEAFLHPGSRL